MVDDDHQMTIDYGHGWSGLPGRAPWLLLSIKVTLTAN